MRTVADIDPTNLNIIARTDWGNVPIPQNYTDLYNNFGDPASGTFEDDYLISLPHQLADGTEIHVISHIAMVPALHDVFGTCRDLISDYGGCYNFRDVRGGTHLSLHSWGLAIDLNVASNPLGSISRNQPDLLVATFEKHGFWWGANFHHRPDPMHFQRAGDF